LRPESVPSGRVGAEKFLSVDRPLAQIPNSPNRSIAPDLPGAIGKTRPTGLPSHPLKPPALRDSPTDPQRNSTSPAHPVNCPFHPTPNIPSEHQLGQRWGSANWGQQSRGH
jgi:hypothetical protein